MPLAWVLDTGVAPVPHVEGWDVGDPSQLGPYKAADRERVSEDDRADIEYGESDSVRTSEDDPDEDV